MRFNVFKYNYHITLKQIYCLLLCNEFNSFLKTTGAVDPFLFLASMFASFFNKRATVSVRPLRLARMRAVSPSSRIVTMKVETS